MIPCYRTHGSKKRINKSIQEECKIWILVVEAYGSVVQFRTYQGATKGKQFASSIKWGLGENVVQRLMECLAPAFDCDIFMDNNYRALHLLTHIGVNNIWATELDYANAINGRNSCQKKRKVATLNSTYQTNKKQRIFDSGWLEQQQVN